MRLKRFVCILCAVLLTALLIPCVTSDADGVSIPKKGDFVLRIDGGKLDEHLETADGQSLLRVNVFLDGVTNERLLSSVSFKLSYDSACLTYVRHTTLKNGMNSFNASVPGLFQFAYISPNGEKLNSQTPLLTLFFSVADGLKDGTLITFGLTEAIKTDSVNPITYKSEKRSVGAILKPFYCSVYFGDANCDGFVTAADAALILRKLTGTTALSAQGERNALVTGGDRLSVQDAATILRWVVKLIDRFPAEP